MNNASEPNEIKPDKTAEDEKEESIEKSQQETINKVEDEEKIEETHSHTDRYSRQLLD